ncbi:D-alanine--D-alanine ligase [Buchnera aphidicola (Schlechtendalia chinensis)]|uniref:D-alanine--D-alanine ligase n=1 Tax=Buchnera aphidicola subsp. Schlechtendalia chinensis TaxID=118110 RepID=A0A172WDE3_BUCSC|nr:D-alanine--D-alanine ligase [Buchnera aphidicola]ANF17000.1 D-alanine--D-alanine ligase [Buchnera aphidicola (Schlechtendalia chinensis)]
MNKKIAVLFGGNSNERNISLLSGNEILRCLLESNMNAYPIDTKYFPISQLPKQGFKKAFIALHGKDGENGVIQGILTHLSIAYTGSKILTSAISIDKMKTKLLWKSVNLPIIPYYFINIKNFIKKTKKNLKNKVLFLGLPLIIKPNTEGSSIGINVVHSYENLHNACKIAFQYGDDILIEKFIHGSEYSIGMLENKIFPSIRICPNNIFYNYESKYFSKNTKYFCPSGLTAKKEKELQNIVKKAWNVLGCVGWGRIDLIMDNFQKFWLLEMNTCPGMTKNSLMPMAAKQVGMSMPSLVLKILQLAN